VRDVHKMTIDVPDDLRLALDAAARQSGQSQAELIRRAGRSYLEDRPQTLPASIGRYPNELSRATMGDGPC
jgi:metal-responsive CopG/Arc/MetJ family transcriptional regulator